MIKHKGDVCIIGLGSGGIGAALACINHGLKVIAIERESSPGGNSVFNGVPDYPAGPGEMYNKWLYQTLHDSKGDRVIGMSVARDGIYSVGSSSLGYDQSLFRYAPVKNYSPANDFEDLKEISPTIIFRADDFSDHVKSSLKLKRNYIQISASATIKTKASEVVKFDEFQVESTTSTDQLPKDQQPTILYETTFEAVQDVENGTDGLKIRSVKCRHGSTEVLKIPNLTFQGLLRWSGYSSFLQPGCFFTKNAWKLAGPLSEELHYCMDLELWLKIAQKLKFVKLNEEMAYAYAHDSAKTTADIEKMRVEIALVVTEFGGREVGRKVLYKMIDDLIEIKKGRFKVFYLFVRIVRKIEKILGISKGH